MTQYACTEITFRHSAKSYNERTCLVAWSLLRGYEIRPSPIFLQSLVLKPFVDCFSLYQESIWRFWFSIIKSSLRFTNSKSKWTRNAVIAVWLPLAKCLNLAGYDALLSPGLRIHDRRSRGRRSDLLKVPQNAKLTEYACWWRQTYNHLRQNNRYLPNMSNALGSAHEKPLNQSRLGIV